MKRKFLSLLLALSMLASFFVVPSAAAYTAKPIESHYFYDQLNNRAQQIYKLLYREFKNGNLQDGTKSYDLVKEGIATDDDVTQYGKGNKDVWLDVCAAKDAFDLDHSEAWYFDSGYLSFRVTEKREMLIGPGRGKTYLLGGKTIDDIDGKDAAIQKKIKEINNKAIADLEQHGSQYSETDKIASLVRSVHDQVISNISYRHEIDCSSEENARYIRTLYGVITHEGVCEAYSRVLQYCLTQLGINCVLVHGIQSKGVPEDHMWVEVEINGQWYATDPTWDDPASMNIYGILDRSGDGSGVDGKETTNYLLVGQNRIAEFWHPSGIVSQGNFEFKYPEISTSSYNGDTIFGDSENNGLVVKYSAGSGSMEEGTPAGVFAMSYNGMSQKEAAKQGIYYLLKMYDNHPDGTYDAMSDWYYVEAAIILLGGNPYFKDSEEDHCTYVYTGTCEYVEVAVTTVMPDNYDQWPSRTNWSYTYEDGFFHGNDSQIVAQSGMLYNVNSSYEAPPYVKSQTPLPNCQGTAGYEYRFDVVYDDDLLHPAEGPMSIDNFVDNSQLAASQTVRVRYVTIQEDLHNGGDMIATITGDLPFDTDRDGYVDMDGGYTDFKWKYSPNCEHANEPGHIHNVNAGCPIVGVEFNFRASDMWQDDITEYCFTIEGVVGSRSNKIPNTFSAVFAVPGACPACYRSQGIDWNLWGKPTLLDAPENLDLKAMAVAGGTSDQALQELSKQMNTRDLNGRLMLVVEDNSKGSGNREEYEKVTDELEEKVGIKEEDVKASSVFEINFNRVCPAVGLKPDKGESLRVQVGYPVGITYEQLGDKVIKAYHFTRCSESNPCDEMKQAVANKTQLTNHITGEHIVGVDEIQVIPNQYGMVIICNSFSPFEVVVLDKNSEAAQNSKFQSTDPILSVVAGENGKVYMGAVEAVGTNGNITFAPGTSKEFTIKPADNYSVDTVSIGGEPITVHNNTFTVNASQVKKNEVLAVSFLPTAVKDSTAATTVAKVCSHSSTHAGKAYKAPTCTTTGLTEERICDECGFIVNPQTEIPATGHTPVEKSAAVAADCEHSGKLARIECKTCHAVLSDGSATQPLGHLYIDYETQKGTATCQHGNARIAKCDRCKVATNTIYDDGVVNHSYDSVKSTKAATCTEDQVDTVQCKWCQKTILVPKPGTKTGHTPSVQKDGTCATCHELICAGDNHKWEATKGITATCTKNGQGPSQKCSVCGLEKPGPYLPPLGHKFNGTHTGAACTTCGETLKADTHTPVPIPDKDATCTEWGTTGGTWCEQCNFIIDPPTPVEPKGHSWTDTGAEWHWSITSDPITASATLKCSVCGAQETFEAVVAEDHVTKQPSCTDTGTGTFKATVKDYTVTRDTVTIPVVPHAPESEEDVVKTPATCQRLATKSFECKYCGNEFMEELEGTTVDHSLLPVAAKSTPATCTEAGESFLSCIWCEYTTTQKTAPSGHRYTAGVCTDCGAADPNYVDSAAETFKITFIDKLDNSTIKEITVNKGDNIDLPTPPTHSGYTFSRWADSEGKAFEASFAATQSVTIYAEYTRNSTSNSSSSSSGSSSSSSTPSTPQVSMKDTTQSVDVTIPANVTSVTLPKEVALDKNIDVTVKGSKPVKVVIPVSKPGPGIVAVIVHKDGTEEVVRDCIMTEDGVALTLDGNTVLKVINNAVDFKDKVEWAAEAMEFVSAREIFKGTGDHIFSPELEMSRGMLVTALHRLAYEPKPGTTNFGDVGSDTYYADAVSWASANGVVNGYGNGTFGPNDDITREQMVTILYRYAKLKGYDTKVSSSLGNFNDTSEVSSYAFDAMSWAISHGLINGMGDGRLAPRASTRRAEVAAIFMRFCENIIG